MDIFNYALQFEHDGEVFYRDNALRVKDPNLADILLFLAAEEQKHYKMIKDYKTASPARPASIFLSDIQNIFTRMKEKQIAFVEEKSTVTEILNKALAIEDESIQYYDKKKNEVDDPKAKELLSILKRQEDAHYSLIGSLLEYYDTPSLWLENAEFNHINEY